MKTQDEAKSTKFAMGTDQMENLRFEMRVFLKENPDQVEAKMCQVRVPR